jgi:hypothetical protein
MSSITTLESLPSISCAGPARPVSQECQARRAAATLANAALLQRIKAASAKRTAQNERDEKTYRRQHNAIS